MQYISAIELKAKQDNKENFILLDVRENYEHEICSIGGLHIPMENIISRVNELPKNQTIVVMCRSGKRAESVGNLLLSELNFSDVLILDGGILSWIDQVDNQLEIY